MRWYFCIDDFGASREIGAWAELAVLSARQNTTLDPICLFDGPEESPFVGRMSNLGVEVRITKTRLSDAIEEAHKKNGYPLHARGAFLRAEVPDHEKDNEFAFYTDCDVVFLSEPKLATLRPQQLSAGPRQNLHDVDQFNSGVLYFNVAGFRAVQEGFFEFAQCNLGRFLPGVDEPIFNHFFRQTFDILPAGLNWRPFFGYNPTASIVHFHGPKLLHIAEFLDTGPSIDWGAYAETLSNLIGSNIDSYIRYLELMQRQFSLPPALQLYVDRIFKAYPAFSTQLPERYSKAEIRAQANAANTARVAQAKNRALNIIFDRLSPSCLSSISYSFSGDAVKYPNLLVSLFRDFGLGVLRRIRYRVEGEPGFFDCDLQSVEVRHGECKKVQEGLHLLGEQLAPQVLIGPQTIPNRRKVIEIIFDCLELTEDSATGIYADSKARFFTVNEVVARRVRSELPFDAKHAQREEESTVVPHVQEMDVSTATESILVKAEDMEAGEGQLTEGATAEEAVPISDFARQEQHKAEVSAPIDPPAQPHGKYTRRKRDAKI